MLDATPPSKHLLGMALSGGGARGFAHLGVLQAFDEENAPIHCFSATSFGALVACFYASGYKSKEIFDIFQKYPPLKLFSLNLKGVGFFSTKKLQKVLSKYLPETFEELSVPVFISTTCLEKNQTFTFSSGNLILPLVGSLSIPILCKPIFYEGNYLYDGGFLNNLPAECIRAKCQTLIGVHTNLPKHTQKPTTKIKTIVERVLQNTINVNAQNSLKYCDLAIEPPQLGDFTALNFKKAVQIYAIGYQYTKEMMPEIVKKMPSK